MDTEILVLESVSFSYPSTPVFEDLNVSFRKGEIVALLGANGAGKTTLLRLLNGLLRPQRGAIFLYGKPLPKKVSKAAKYVGIAFQNPTHQFFASSVLEELEYAVRWTRDGEQAEKERLQTVARQFDLEHLLERSPFTLSSGEQRRLSIATIVVLGSDIIGLDEPTVGQDVRSRRILKDLLVSLKQSGVGVIAATHDVEWIAPIADRVLLLNGESPIEGTAVELLGSESILRSAALRVPQLVDLGSRLKLKASGEDWDSLNENVLLTLSRMMSDTYKEGTY